jgi:hypothetical protein
MNDLNPDARRLVDLARQARTPGADDKRRIAQRLAVPLAASAAVGTAVGAAQAGTSLLGSVGAKVAALVAVSAVGAAVFVARLRPEPVVVAGKQAVSAQPFSAPPESSPPPRVPEASAPAAPAAVESATPPKATAPPSSAKASDDLAQEAALLHQAQSAWRAGNSAEALVLANQHAKRFPRSQLANERDVLRVLSLCKLGRVQAAKDVGARLLRQTKGSPWYQSVAESCAAD